MRNTNVSESTPTQSLASEPRGNRRVAVNICDFGGDPSGKRSSTPAIRRAIRAARAVPTGAAVGGVIYFPAGRYKLTTAPTNDSEL